MLNTLILPLAGFIICFVLLFYFTAKYRAALAAEAELEDSAEEFTVMTVAKPSFASRAAVLDSLEHSSVLEVEDMKEKVKSLHYQLEEMKVAQDKNNAEMNKILANMEQRLSTFEQEYVTKLQPTLLSLIEDLEQMKLSGNTDSKK